MVNYNSFNLDPDKWWAVIKGTLSVVFRVPKRIYLLIPEWVKIIILILLIILSFVILRRILNTKDDFYMGRY